MPLFRRYHQRLQRLQQFVPPTNTDSVCSQLAGWSVGVSPSRTRLARGESKHLDHKKWHIAGNEPWRAYQCLCGKLVGYMEPCAARSWPNSGAASDTARC